MNRKNCTEIVEVSPNGPVVALNVPIGQQHTIRMLESSPRHYLVLSPDEIMEVHGNDG